MGQMEIKEWNKLMSQKYLDWRHNNKYFGEITKSEVVAFVYDVIIETKEVLKE